MLYQGCFTDLFTLQFSVLKLMHYGPEAATGGVLKNFAKFTGKHLYQSLFFSKVAGTA